MFEKKEKPTPTFSKRHGPKFRSSKKKTLFASLKVNITSLFIRRFHRTCVLSFSSHQRCDHFTILPFTDKNLTHKAQLRTKKKSQDGRKFQVKVE